jgi:sugar lactone lactonase YvrE
VTDAMNFRVQVFDADGKFVRMFGHLGDAAGDFDKPKGIAVDGSGRIYVVEGLNDVVQVFSPEGRLLAIFGGSGGGPGQLWLPAGITLSGNNVFVADAANRRVQVFERLGEAR